MKRLFLFALAASVPAAASATGGLLCSTASGPPTQIRFVVGHGEAGGVVSARRQTGADWRPVDLAQAWISDRELRVDLADAQRLRRLARIEASRRGRTYDGTIVEGGRRRWIRCRED